MRTKSRLNLLIFFFLAFFIFSSNLYAEEFNISAKEIFVDKENEILTGKGSVTAIDSEGKVINADKITYEKLREFILAEGKVKIADIEGNIFIADKATYDKKNNIITTYNNTELTLREGYKLITKKVSYRTKDKILSSNDSSILTDNEGNYIETDMFRYQIKTGLFSSVGKIKIIDIKKNKYFFKEIYVDTKKKEMIGSNVSVILDQENFGVKEESDPRFVANDILIKKNITSLSKGVFTVCKKRDGKCPPWSLKAKKINHDKIKKTIYYEHATLKLYDIPIFYFPKFFHPDPTVKRQSGFLAPFFTNNTTVGPGFALPYYWAMGDNKDLTFSPKIYSKENVLFLNEYRQAFRNGFLTLDTGYTEGYKNTSKTKTDGSRNHIFADLNLNFNQDESYQSNLHLKIQKTSNDTYFKKHDINTALVDSENTNLENEIKYSFSNDDTFFDIAATAYENLSTGIKSDKYEYILPNIMYGKTFFTEKFGTLNFTSNVLYSKFETNKNKTFLTNDIIWSPSSYITKKGFMNSFEGMVRNTNYEARKTEEYKNKGTVNELNTVITYKSSLPLRKDGINYSKFFSPNFMLRYAPGHMRSLSGDDTNLKYANLSSATLKGANFAKANLENAIFDKTGLSSASLEESSMRKSYLSSVLAVETNFSRADLYKANVYKSNMSKSNFKNSIVVLTNFNNVILNNSDFSASNAAGSMYAKVEASFTKFKKAVLNRLKVKDSNFSGADFEEADLRVAVFLNSNLNLIKNTLKRLALALKRLDRMECN